MLLTQLRIADFWCVFAKRTQFCLFIANTSVVVTPSNPLSGGNSVSGLLCRRWIPFWGADSSASKVRDPPVLPVIAHMGVTRRHHAVGDVFLLQADTDRASSLRLLHPTDAASTNLYVYHEP